MRMRSGLCMHQPRWRRCALNQIQRDCQWSCLSFVGPSILVMEVVSNRWTGLWTGLLDWIAGLDSEERCQTNMQECMCSEDLCLARSYGHS